MNSEGRKARYARGFTLIQVSILLTVAALVMVTVLPGLQTNLNANSVSVTRMNAVLTALRQYEAATGVLPCPADAGLAIGSANYGKAGVYGPNCGGGTPSANYSDTTNTVAIGMVPVRALGLSNDYALDGYGRYITYAVDTRAAYNSYGYPVWSLTSPGKIIIDDNGTTFNTAVALVSHGADGHGAWLPLNAASGTGQRLNAGSTDTDQHMVNAHGTAGGGFPANYSNIASLVTDAAGHSVTFVKKPPTSTFDDLVVYKNPLWNINQLPLSIPNMVTVSPPANGVYVMGEPLNFTATFPGIVTTGANLSCGGWSNQPGWPYLGLVINGTQVPVGCFSGSGTNTLTFTYPISAFFDYAPETGTSGVSIGMLVNGSPVAMAMNENFASVAISGVPAPASVISNQLGMIIPANTNAAAAYFRLPGNGSGVLNGTGGGGATNSSAGVLISAPPGIAVDTSTHCSGPCINVVDTLNSRVTQWSTGLIYNRTFGTPASTPFTPNTGTFTNPSGIVADSSNNLYVVDSYNNRIEKWTNASPPAYTSGNYFGSAGTSVGQFSGPTGIAIDTTATSACGTNGCLWIADAGNERVQRCSTTGACLNYTAMKNFVNPTGIAVDNVHCTTPSQPCIYVADTSNNRVLGFSVTGNSSNNSSLIQTIPSGCSNSAPACPASFSNGKFSSPIGIAMDGAGNLWVADGMNNRVQEFSLVSGTWTWEMTIGGGGVCSGCTLNAYPTVSSASTLCYNNAACTVGSGSLYFNNPTGIAVDTSGNIYVVDDNNSRVVKCTSPRYTSCTSFGSYGTGSSQFNF